MKVLETFEFVRLEIESTLENFIYEWPKRFINILPYREISKIKKCKIKTLHK